ncbi:hypothetical protein EJB05_55837 [Eragrostis curvula]|uniref:Uncharacterized protein n=1 Tax=Eragrostis curvula TaxID=38414 RepID=A0A5J9SII0_9POAL|nr:hypothetical protein EJB05_55837 [Eragrostis curvula]
MPRSSSPLAAAVTDPSIQTPPCFLSTAGWAAPLGSRSGQPAAPLLGSPPPRLPPCFLADPLGCVVQRLAAAQQHEEFEYHSHTIYVSIILLPDSLLGQPSVKRIEKRSHER